MPFTTVPSEHGTAGPINKLGDANVVLVGPVLRGDASEVRINALPDGCRSWKDRSASEQICQQGRTKTFDYISGSDVTAFWTARVVHRRRAFHRIRSFPTS